MRFWTMSSPTGVDASAAIPSMYAPAPVIIPSVDVAFFTRDAFSPDGDNSMSEVARMVSRCMLGVRGVSATFCESGRPTTAHPLVDVGITHSGDVGVAAIGWGTLVGIDLEGGRWSWNDHFARRICTDDEYALVAAAPAASANLQLKAFWTRKEAYLKLGGIGLAMRPSSIRVVGRDAGVSTAVPLPTVYLRSWGTSHLMFSLATTAREVVLKVYALAASTPALARSRGHDRWLGRFLSPEAGKADQLATEGARTLPGS